MTRISRPDPRKGYALSERFQRVLRREARLGDAPNVLSIAVAIQWGDRRILLGSDVMNGTRNRSSGWKGILFHLENDDETKHIADIVRLVDLVKVAHHGSSGAFHEPAWQRHAKPEGGTVAVLTPFQSKLPQEQTLARLASFVGRVGISSQEGGAAARARRAGWTDVDAPAPVTTAPCIAVVLRQAGDIELFRGAGAALLRRPLAQA